jgi:hypothetical protein
MLSTLAITGTAWAQDAPVPSASGSQSDTVTLDPSLRRPAVSEINGKVDYAGGDMDSAEGHNFSGSITLPVSHQFGIQGDALYSRISDLNFYGGAGHFFWRRPDVGLLGLTGGYLYRDNEDNVGTFQAGAEGEYYWRQFTFGFFGGLGSIDYRYSAPFIDTNPTRFIGRVSADYYVLEDLRIGASFTTAFRDSLGHAEIEYQTPVPGLALTGEAAWGDNGYDHWLFGVRYYFGGKKTLRDRQRQDDPRSLMPQILHSLGVYGAEFNRKENAYINAHPGSGSTGGGGVYGVITVDAGPGSTFIGPGAVTSGAVLNNLVVPPPSTIVAP